MPAENLDQVYNFFSNAPIPIDRFDELYVDPIEGRGDNPMRVIMRRLKKNPGGSMKIIFAGYRGCGKSTELNRLQKILTDQFIVLNFSVLKELDPVSLNYIELFIVTMEKLFELAEKENLKISKKYLKLITNWIQSKEIVKVKEIYLGTDLEVGAEASATIPFLSKFFARWSASAKASGSMTETLKKEVEPKLSTLISNCNLLIREVKSSLKKSKKKGLIIVIEDLDKLPIGKAEELFFNYSSQLVRLHTHTIFTFPISLVYHPRFTYIRNSFDEDFELPMIKVNNKDGKPYEQGKKVMRDIVARRMNLSLFESKSLLDEMIAYSGGCLRDLFRLIIDAADKALDFERELISKTDLQKAYYKLRRDYSNTIAEKREGHDIITRVEEYYAALVKVIKDPNKVPDNTGVVLDLRQNLSILGYNDIRWCDVHPIVKDILKDKGLLND